MRSERLIWIAVIAVLLLAGWLMGRAFHVEDDYATEEIAAFRAWFWEHRTLDLLSQVGLIFAGSLGVAALLPGQREMREIHAQSEKPHAPLA
jgi:hypothetical protein